MRLSYSTKTQAQTRADKIYQDMLAGNISGAGTNEWAIPYLEGGKWHVTVNNRCACVLTPEEILLLWPETIV